MTDTAPSDAHRFESVPAVRESLAKVDYLADEGIAGVVYLADRLGKPVLVEGPAGTGKTQLAKSVAEISGARLIRLQLEAIRAEEPVVLLIDEVDGVEVETGALLLGIHSDYQVTNPELGAVEA